MIFRHQHSRDIHFATTNMSVNINATGHHNFAGNVDGFIDSGLSTGLGNYFTVSQVEIFFPAVQSIFRVVEYAAFQFG